MKTQKTTTIILLMLLIPTISFAQRLLPDQYHIETSFSLNDFSFTGDTHSLAAAIEFGRFLSTGEWYCGTQYDYMRDRVSVSSVLTHRIHLYGGYLHRVAANYSKTVVFSIGCAAACGYELIDKSSIAPGIILPAGDGFIYGIIPRGDIDFFVGRYFALGVRIAPTLLFGSDMGIFNINYGISFKYCL